MEQNTPLQKVVPLRPEKSDFRERTDDLYRQLLARLPDVLRYLLPNGVFLNGKFLTGDTAGNKGESLVVSLQGEKAGLWHDFATDEGGNLIGLWAAVKGFDARTRFPALMEDIGGWLGAASLQVSPPKRDRPPDKMSNLGPLTAKWDYTDKNGLLIASVYRFDPPERKKEFRPWDAVHGCMRLPNPRPLYNQTGMASADAVILVEGEKCAQALIDAGFCATTAMSGANTAVDKTDWSPLQGKRVLIWPDNDEAGHKYAVNCASATAKAGARTVDILRLPEGKPDKWDVADATEEGFDIARYIETAERIAAKEAPAPSETLPAFSFGELCADDSPMPDDLIAPRLLTPAGLLVFAGAPKVGKSDFLISLLAHMAAGVPFLGLSPHRPLRVFYLQAEIQYHYLRERMRSLTLPPEVRSSLNQNLVITAQTLMTLNEAGVKRIAESIRKHFPCEAPDIIAIDPIRNVFDGGPHGDGENDNNAMLFFLQARVEVLRQMVNPEAGVILTHHTRKAAKRVMEEDPFQSFSGAGSLRSYYSSGVLLMRPDETAPERTLLFELRNGPEIPAKLIRKVNGRWQELDSLSSRKALSQQGEKMDTERRRRHDVILRLIYNEARHGRVYTARQFSEKFETTSGLGGERSIRERINVLATQGYIRFFRNAEAYGIKGVKGTPQGYLCVEGMVFQNENQEILPTHYKCPQSGTILNVENPYRWDYNDAEEQA